MEVEYGFESQFAEIEILRVADYNTIARGRRYGRWWLLKGLPPGKKDSIGLRRRMNKEFEIHSRLRHIAIPLVVGIEEVDKLGPCIVMEWVEGETLSQLIDKRKLTKRESEKILEGIVDALSFVHSMGIAHRDLKLSNIMIRKSGGGVALIDFGLADSDNYAELKNPAGTIGYISEEQKENGGTDPADDIFSLGVIIKLIAPHYKSLARRCTAPKKNRPQNASELALALEKRKKRPQILLVLLLCVLSCAIIFLLFMVSSITENSVREKIIVQQIESANWSTSQKAAVLEDSLLNMSLRLADAENRQRQSESLQAEAESREKIAADKLAERDRIDGLKSDAMQRGVAMIDELIREYDKQALKLKPADWGGMDKLLRRLNDEYSRRLDSFCSHSVSG